MGTMLDKTFKHTPGFAEWIEKHEEHMRERKRPKRPWEWDWLNEQHPPRKFRSKYDESHFFSDLIVAAVWLALVAWVVFNVVV